MPEVTIIVVNFNAGRHLVNCLTALKAQSFGDFGAVILDNASTDGSFAAARDAVQDARFEFIQMPTNLGFAAANNHALVLATTSLVAFLNPDTVPAPDWLAALIAAAHRHPKAASFGSAQIKIDPPDRLDGAGDAYFVLGVPWRGGYGHPVDLLPAEGEIFSACAAASLHRMAALRAAGFFDERFFCYCEDVDLGFRLRLLGHTAVHVPAARVGHVGGASAGQGSDFQLYHGARNLVWVYVKNMPTLLFWLLLPGHLMVETYLFLRYAVIGRGSVVARAFRDSWCALAAVWRDRRRIQGERTVSTAEIARALCWSPWPLMRRLPYVRPLQR